MRTINEIRSELTEAIIGWALENQAFATACAEGQISYRELTGRTVKIETGITKVLNRVLATAELLATSTVYPEVSDETAAMIIDDLHPATGEGYDPSGEYMIMLWASSMVKEG